MPKFEEITEFIYSADVYLAMKFWLTTTDEDEAFLIDGNCVITVKHSFQGFTIHSN